jgi:hypothetical protein
MSGTKPPPTIAAFFHVYPDVAAGAAEDADAVPASVAVTVPSPNAASAAPRTADRPFFKLLRMMLLMGVSKRFDRRCGTGPGPGGTRPGVSVHHGINS